mmetsp:Transcript_7897/g.17432  ORF Transcript_7897/g.17432 Transcript_7897/m.17432 type:complete len:533 (+) Transcript_7897:39-1637(+)
MAHVWGKTLVLKCRCKDRPSRCSSPLRSIPLVLALFLVALMYSHGRVAINFARGALTSSIATRTRPRYFTSRSSLLLAASAREDPGFFPGNPDLEPPASSSDRVSAALAAREQEELARQTRLLREQAQLMREEIRLLREALATWSPPPSPQQQQSRDGVLLKPKPTPTRRSETQAVPPTAASLSGVTQPTSRAPPVPPPVPVPPPSKSLQSTFPTREKVSPAPGLAANPLRSAPPATAAPRTTFPTAAPRNVPGALRLPGLSPAPLSPPQARGPSAQETPATSRTQVKIVSAGLDAGDAADFFLDDALVPIAGPFNRRGVNVVVLSPSTGGVVSARAYDVWGNPSVENARLATDLRAVPDGQIVLVALKDSGMENINMDVLDALEACGSTLESRLGFREAYALIGQKGGVALAELSGPRMLLAEAEVPFGATTQKAGSVSTAGAAMNAAAPRGPGSTFRSATSGTQPSKTFQASSAPAAPAAGGSTARATGAQPVAAAAPRSGGKTWEEVLQILQALEADILAKQQRADAGL